ncbi:MAG: response regulator [Lachnotalea sp.]
MKRVFLVEDEIIMREGIKNNIDWEQEGFQFVGEASDGELAYPMIKSTKPDILITDIKMPFMDGLELSRMVKKDFPNIKIIILSGYSEFDYAKQAINIGVTDYLLKPVSSSKLIEAIKKIGEMINKEMEEQQLLEKYKKEMEENAEHEKQRFFNKIIKNKLSLAKVVEDGNRIGVDLIAGAYNVLLLKINAKESPYEYSQNLITTLQKINKLLQNNQDVIKFECDNEILAIIIKADTEEKIDLLMSHYCNRLREILDSTTDTEYFGGIGRKVTRISELQDSYNIANKAVSARYFTEMNQIVNGMEFSKFNPYSHEVIDMEEINSEKMNQSFINKFLKNGTKDEIGSFSSEYFLSIGSVNIKSMLFRQYIIMDIYFCVTAFMESIGYSKTKTVEEFGDFNKLNQIIVSIEKSKEYVELLFFKALNLRDAISMKKYEDTVKMAYEYIQENYDKDDISLNTVAASVNISPTYFSAIFSQETGHTFIECLTQTRMNKAKELLMCSNMRTAEIGYEVGYKDSHYFSYIFKKTQLCTPKEYRTRGRSN